VTIPIAIEAKGLSKGFQQETGEVVQVLDGFNLTVKSGETVCIFGANGCGKTTLLGICGGIENPDSGSITVLGAMAPHARVGYVPQAYGESLFPWMSLLDNVAFPLRVCGSGWNEARGQAAQLLQEFAPSLVATKYSYQYSGGQKQVSAVARALVASPRLLIADEPFSALDHSARIAAQDVFVSLVDRLQLTVVAVTHDVKDAIYIADRVLIVSGPPLRVVDEVAVALPRPRPPSIRASATFLSLVSRAIDSFLAAQT